MAVAAVAADEAAGAAVGGVAAGEGGYAEVVAEEDQAGKDLEDR